MTYEFSRNIYLNTAESRASDRAALYSSTLVSALERYQHLPFILSRDTFVIEGLQKGGAHILNLRLQRFAEQSQVDALYIMNANGLTIASSNWQEVPTFLGKNYGFRPYFQTAIEGGRGEFFAIGVTTHTPGYFVAEPIRNVEGEILGVIAMKVDLSSLTRSWREGGEKVIVTNPEGIVVLSSDEKWNYKSLVPLSAQALKEIQEEKQFVGQDLSSLEINDYSDNSLTLDQVSYLQHIMDIPYLGWRLHYLADMRESNQQAETVVLITAIVLIILLSIYLLLRSEKIKKALRASEADRGSLRALNESLEKEIEQRRKAQEKLAMTQKELRQASKLAALGQLAASVSHELGQPISAMQNYLAWADLPDSNVDPETRDVFARLSRLVARMAAITKQLKFFARPTSSSEDKIQDVDLRDVIAGVREIMQPDLKLHKIQYLEELTSESVIVRGDRLRLEQVLINLMRNALDAMRENGGHHMTIRLEKEENMAVVNVLDRGPGLPEEISQSLFDSFVTTKASGEGMGLGLAISASIVEDHGGEIKARSRETGGAEFSMRLPLHLPRAGSSLND
ncbi:MAG: ATP-binding protein [Alphaproteobacteria bacterium]|nr:ATP-binding protein [Alphaproteobacteria bacterium]